MPARKPDPAERAGYLDELADVAMGMNPAVLAAIEEYLDPADRRVIERIIAEKKGAGWRRDPFTMAHHFGALDDLPHTRLLAQKVREAFDGTSPRQIWNLPPQHGKSELVKWGCVWILDTDPTATLGLFSYADRLARKHAVFVRDTLIGHGADLRTRLRPGQQRQNEFVTNEGGGLQAAGLGGAITGFGFNGVFIDDPYKGWEEAHSDATREGVWNGYEANITTRLNHRHGVPAFIIVVQTRWHESDLSGTLIEQDESGDGEHWELVRLPALAEDDDPLGRARGEALAPTLHSLEELQAQRQNRGSYLFAGLYQQRPSPEEGGEIKRAWFQFRTDFPPRFDQCVSSWDTKFKDREGGDYVVGQAWGRTGASMWCYDQFRGQYNFVTTKVALALMSVRHPEITHHLVENTGNGPEVMRDMRAGMGDHYDIDAAVVSQLGITVPEVSAVTDVLRHGLTGLIPITVKGDKRVRVRRNLGVLEGKHVNLPEGRLWTTVLVDESAAFPTGAHDDCVDAMTQALDRLKNFGEQPPARLRRDVVSPRPSARATRARRR